MRTRLFLRTTEFLWQEGHTAHATSEEAMQESLRMLNIYAQFAEDVMAIPVIQGEKTASERFPGAVNTYCIEALMQDNKALQAGTSHFLGQHFSRGFNIKYLSKTGKEEFVWTTSWGVSTRLIGGLIMTHSDDNGLVLPPKLAPTHIVILPIIHKEEDRITIMEYAHQLSQALNKIHYHDRHLAIEIDTRELPGGEKAWQWVKKGVPIRLEVGNKEYTNQSVFMGRRDQEYKNRKSISQQEFLATVVKELDEIQTNLLQRARERQKQNSTIIHHQNDFYEFFENDGGFAYAHWNGDAAIEAKIKAELSVTIRCMPFAQKSQPGKCIFTGEQSSQQVIFATAY